MEKLRAFCGCVYWFIHRRKSKTVTWTSSLIMIPYLTSVGCWNVIKNILVLTPAINVYSELEKNNPSIFLLLQKQPFKTISFMLFLVGILLLVIKFVFRPIAYVLSQRSLNGMELAPIEKGLVNPYKIKKCDIDLYQEVKNGKLSTALEKQDSIIERLKRERKAHQPIFYCGIAHTPFVFRAGFSIGDESNNITALHKASS